MRRLVTLTAIVAFVAAFTLAYGVGPATVALAADVLLDDIAGPATGFIRACVGDFGALGESGCPSISGQVGLRYDPDGAAGPLVESEDSNEGLFEERWCVEYDGPGGNVNLCNTVAFGTAIPGFANVAGPGPLQATGSGVTPDGRLRIDQGVSLAPGSQCLNFNIALTNVGGATLNNVEYLRNHDSDLGIDLGLGFITDNQTISRPLPGTPPMIVASTVRDFSPVETRTVGLGTNANPPSGAVADVSIGLALIQSDPDAVIDGIGITRGPLVADLSATLAYRIDSLAPGDLKNISFCYCFASRTADVDRATVAADITGVFVADCTPPPDHFLCYKAEGAPVNAVVDLEDQFGDQPQVLVSEPELFCNPVDKNGEGINDETAHLTCYDIESNGDEVVRDVTVLNQFGEQTLTVTEAEHLCVPSEKNAVPSDLNLDHFKCYKAQGDPVEVFVELEDQFIDHPQVLVGEPELFCNPVKKDKAGEEGKINNPLAHLTCYDIDRDEEERDVVVTNQLITQTLEVEDPELLCVPSVKLSFVEQPTDDDDDDDEEDGDDDDDEEDGDDDDD